VLRLLLIGEDFLNLDICDLSLIFRLFLLQLIMCSKVWLALAVDIIKEASFKALCEVQLSCEADDTMTDFFVYVLSASLAS